MNADTHTGRLLHEDHMRTLDVLNRMEAIIGRWGPGTPLVVTDVERKLLKSFIEVLDRELGMHLDFEEEVLFPKLAEAGGGDLADMLTEEHESIRPFASQLRDMASQALESGFGAEDWAAFHELAGELIGREIFHLQKEEMGLLHALGMMLTPEDDAEIAALYEERRA